ncbi:hypothetical protein CRUP_010683 [Coryphaenoides rupestris]|nr:hypothetical protein CRUP_010683 [Coryphaenoides rupestris]
MRNGEPPSPTTTSMTTMAEVVKSHDPQPTPEMAPAPPNAWQDPPYLGVNTESVETSKQDKPSLSTPSQVNEAITEPMRPSYAQICQGSRANHSLSQPAADHAPSSSEGPAMPSPPLTPAYPTEQASDPTLFSRFVVLE